MTSFPLKVKNEAVSTTISPVTQEALAEVNKAVKKVALPGWVVICGNINKPVPIPIRKQKLKINEL